MIKQPAERRAGELLIEMAASGERRVASAGIPKKADTVSGLRELGISKKQSSRWVRRRRLYGRTVCQTEDRQVATVGVARHGQGILAGGPLTDQRQLPRSYKSCVVNNLV